MIFGDVQLNVIVLLIQVIMNGKVPSLRMGEMPIIAAVDSQEGDLG